MNLRTFLASWNGILCILFIGLYLMYPAIKGLFVVAEPGSALEVNQIQSFVGGLAVIWALRAIWRKRSQDKDPLP